MSLYIKGMKMPKNCLECPLVVCLSVESDCPLVEIQPHGRLGDLVELEKRLQKELKRHNDKRMTPSWNDAVLCVLETPTIIEREE